MNLSGEAWEKFQADMMGSIFFPLVPPNEPKRGSKNGASEDGVNSRADKAVGEPSFLTIEYPPQL